MNDYNRHIVHTLRAAGYRFRPRRPAARRRQTRNIGYDQILQPKTTSAVDVAPVAVEFLDTVPTAAVLPRYRLLRDPPRIPSPHAADDPRFIQPPAPIADTPQTRVDMAGLPLQRARSR